MHARRVSYRFRIARRRLNQHRMCNHSNARYERAWIKCVIASIADTGHRNLSTVATMPNNYEERGEAVDAAARARTTHPIVYPESAVHCIFSWESGHFALEQLPRLVSIDAIARASGAIDVAMYWRRRRLGQLLTRLLFLLIFGTVSTVNRSFRFMYPQLVALEGGKECLWAQMTCQAHRAWEHHTYQGYTKPYLFQ